jgi:hypothetical protein
VAVSQTKTSKKEKKIPKKYKNQFNPPAKQL